jgi:hypothetical protein
LSDRRAAAYLFAALTALFLADGSFIAANGQTPNGWLAVAVLEHHALSFSPDEEPFMYNARGREKYYLVRSSLPGRSVGTFGLGAGLVALPAMAVARLAVGDLRARPGVVWITARAVAAATVAGSAVFVFLAAAALLSRRQALAVALAYAVGSCAWSIASQALYQHGPNMLFVAAAAYALTRDDRRGAAWAGLALAAATWCRPTSAVYLIAVAAWLLRARRHAVVPFVAAAALPIALLALYQWHYLGSPWETGQTARAASVAMYKTGASDVWQTPLALGAAGLFLSPSRGLFVFSPLFALALPGAFVAFREARWAWLRPLILGAVILTVAACKWFDWWGGWTYGYRPLVDLTPILALATLPVIEQLFIHPWHRWRQACAGVLLAWSVAVQALGAFAYDVDGWNARDGRDIDSLAWRDRLWSLRDSQIVYYATHFGAARWARLGAVDDYIAQTGR